MLGGLLYNLGNNLLATPARLVVGLIFLSQGIQNLGNQTVEEAADLMFSIKDYGIEGLGADALSVLLIIAGIAAILGIFVRLVGGIMAFIIITNLFAGFNLDANFLGTVVLLQDRLILAIGAMTLFFLGGGFFCLDGLIFGGVKSAIGGDDKKDDKAKE